MRFALILFASIGIFTSAHAQDISLTPDEIAIKQVVLNVFDAMREVDSIKMKSCFTEEVELYTAFNHRQKGSILSKGELGPFITSIGTPHEGLYDEKLGDFEVFVDDSLASFIVDYYFFVDEEFSHCGVDFFQLHKKNGTWRIFFLSDTRRKSNCDIPEKTW